jgi:hypothetical protein
MIADVSLADKGRQERFGFSSSLALVNISIMKGQPAHQEGGNLLQEGGGGHNLPQELGET